MDKTATPFRSNAARPSRRGAKPDYKQKLERASTLSQNRVAATDDAAAALLSPTDQVRSLAQHADVESTAFQCVAVAALQILDRVLYHERRAAEAALSLAQREQVETMAEDVEATAQALRLLISPQGAKMLGWNNPRPSEEPPETSWWFALSEALYVLEAGSAWTHAIVAGQPRDGAPRTLSSILAGLLRAHYCAFLTEAEQWMA